MMMKEKNLMFSKQLLHLVLPFNPVNNPVKVYIIIIIIISIYEVRKLRPRKVK